MHWICDNCQLDDYKKEIESFSVFELKFSFEG